MLLQKNWKAMYHFNSQPHEEADNQPTQHYSVYHHFNSQPHEEADNKTLIGSPIFFISTHSLTRRLTEEQQWTKQRNRIFQLTASRGG